MIDEDTTVGEFVDDLMVTLLEYVTVSQIQRLYKTCEKVGPLPFPVETKEDARRMFEYHRETAHHTEQLHAFVTTLVYMSSAREDGARILIKDDLGITFQYPVGTPCQHEAVIKKRRAICGRCHRIHANGSVRCGNTNK